jgi:hypothetical protein
MGCVAILRDAVLRTAPQDEVGMDAGTAEYRKAVRTVNADASSDAILQVVPIPNAWSNISDHRG